MAFLYRVYGAIIAVSVSAPKNSVLGAIRVFSEPKLHAESIGDAQNGLFRRSGVYVEFFDDHRWLGELFLMFK